MNVKRLFFFLVMSALFSSSFAMGRKTESLWVRNVGQTAISVQWEFNFDSDKVYDTEYNWWHSESWSQSLGTGKLQESVDIHDSQPEKNYAVVEPGCEVELVNYYLSPWETLVKNPDAISCMDKARSLFRVLTITCADGSSWDLDTMNDSMFIRHPDQKLAIMLEVAGPPGDKLFPPISTAAETIRDVLVPFEIGGKIGFVNQRLEKITEAKYRTLLAVSKHCAVVFTEEYDYEVITPRGVVLTSDQRPYLVGDEHYTFYEEIPLPRVSRGRSDIHWRKNIIRSAFSPEASVIYDLELLGGSSLSCIVSRNPYNKEAAWLNYISSDGVYLFPHENSFNVLQCFDEALSRGVVLDKDWSIRLVDETGASIGNASWRWLGPFSAGLVPGVQKDTGESGYYDKDGTLVIPAVFKVDDIIYKGWGTSFGSGVVPCRIIDNVIHIGVTKAGFVTPDWAIMDTTGNIVASKIQATHIYEFSDGVAVLFHYDSSAMTYRLLRPDGTFLMADQFDFIHSSTNGYCRAKKDGVDYLIRSSDGAVYRCDGLGRG